MELWRESRLPLELPVNLGNRSCFLREGRSPLVFQGPPRDVSHIAAAMNRASSRHEMVTSVFLSISDFDRRVSAELEQESQVLSCDEVGTPLASRVVHGVTGHLSCCIWNLRLFLDDATGVSVPLHVVTSSSGLHLKRCPGIGTFLEWTGKSVSFRMWHNTRGFFSNFSVRLASSCSGTCRSGSPSRQSRGIDPHVQIRRGEGAQIKWCRETWCSS